MLQDHESENGTSNSMDRPSRQIRRTATGCGMGSRRTDTGVVVGGLATRLADELYRTNRILGVASDYAAVAVDIAAEALDACRRTGKGPTRVERARDLLEAEAEALPYVVAAQLMEEAACVLRLACAADLRPVPRAKRLPLDVRAALGCGDRVRRARFALEYVASLHARLRALDEGVYHHVTRHVRGASERS